MMRQFVAGMFLFVVSAQAAVAAEDKLYRYHNNEGVTVIDFSVPPQHADKGYEVLSPSGRVLEVVPGRKLLDSEALTSQVPAVDEREDAYILRSYSSVSEVSQARKRRLSMIDNEITVLETNVGEYQAQYQSLAASAARYQGSGNKVPASLVTRMEEMTRLESNAKKLIEERQQEYQALNNKYDHYSRRLIELKNISETDSVEERATVPATAPSASD